MIVETSAIIAISTEEPGYEHLLDAIDNSPDAIMSAFSLYEAAVVIFKRTGSPDRVADVLAAIDRLRIRIVPFDRQAAINAAEAYQKFGKGVHPAGLNLGDCPAYALAQSTGLPLLFKGDDFSKTDVKSA